MWKVFYMMLCVMWEEKWRRADVRLWHCQQIFLINFPNNRLAVLNALYREKISSSCETRTRIPTDNNVKCHSSSSRLILSLFIFGRGCTDVIRCHVKVFSLHSQQQAKNPSEPKISDWGNKTNEKKNVAMTWFCNQFNNFSPITQLICHWAFKMFLSLCELEFLNNNRNHVL